MIVFGKMVNLTEEIFIYQSGTKENLLLELDME